MTTVSKIMTTVSIKSPSGTTNIDTTKMGCAMAPKSLVVEGVTYVPHVAQPDVTAVPSNNTLPTEAAKTAGKGEASDPKVASWTKEEPARRKQKDPRARHTLTLDPKPRGKATGSGSAMRSLSSMRMDSPLWR